MLVDARHLRAPTICRVHAILTAEPNSARYQFLHTSMENNPTNKPSYIAYVVQEDEANGSWTKIGAAWMHSDGKGLSIMLDALPLSGRVVLREHGEPSDIHA